MENAEGSEVKPSEDSESVNPPNNGEENVNQSEPSLNSPLATNLKDVIETRSALETTMQSPTDVGDNPPISDEGKLVENSDTYVNTKVSDSIQNPSSNGELGDVNTIAPDSTLNSPGNGDANTKASQTVPPSPSSEKTLKSPASDGDQKANHVPQIVIVDKEIIAAYDATMMNSFCHATCFAETNYNNDNKKNDNNLPHGTKIQTSSTSPNPQPTAEQKPTYPRPKPSTKKCNPGDGIVHGYINKSSGIRYVNACQQTDFKQTKPEHVLKFTRETQLCLTRHQKGNTIRETWTQMDRPGIILDSTRDYVLVPGPYEDSKAWEEKRNKAATIIQRYARTRIARRKAKKLREYQEQKLELVAELERLQKEEEELRLKAEIDIHRHPRKKKDFQLLYEELEAWHREELRSINEQELFGDSRKLALQELLKKEVGFLHAIDKMKCVAGKENKEEKIKSMMCQMSASKKWELSNGRVVHVQTPDTLRAADLLRLYTALAKCSKTVDERMCVLGYIKWTVQEFECSLTKELLQLIEREADLMYRSRPSASLVGLRKRILNLFLQFVLEPKFNPESSTFKVINRDFDHTSYQNVKRQANNLPPFCQSSC